MAVNKHINFFEFEKAAIKPGCPLCTIVNERADRYIDNLLFEHVADRGFRAVFRAAGGFCPFHSRNLVSFRDGLAVAILSRDILEDRIATFSRSGKWSPRGQCPICIEKAKIEEEYLSFLASTDGNSDEEKELREIMTACDGLCVPHYASLLHTPKGWPRSVPRWIKNLHEEKFFKLLERVDKYIELSAYGRQEEFAALSEKDQLVWKEAAASLRGNVE